MWSELAYLAEKRCRESESRHEAARALLVLYGALGNCEIAFERVEDDGGDEARDDAVLAMDALFATLWNLQQDLGLFEGQQAERLRAWLHGGPGERDAGSADALRRQVSRLRRLLSVEEADAPLEVPAPTAFTGARHELARFILERFKAEELFSADR